MIPIPKFDVCPELVLWEDRKDTLYKILPRPVSEKSWREMERPISAATSPVESSIKNEIGT